jgi:hypothetical protein
VADKATVPWRDGDANPPEIQQALGFKPGKTPCASTLYNLFRRYDWQCLSTRLAQWGEAVLEALPPDQIEAAALAIDSQTLRGSRQQGAQPSPLLSAMHHAFCVVFAQEARANHENELTRLPQRLPTVSLKRRIVPCDALLTQPKIAKQLRQRGGHHVLVVKDNPPWRREEIEYGS